MPLSLSCQCAASVCEATFGEEWICRRFRAIRLSKIAISDHKALARIGLVDKCDEGGVKAGNDLVRGWIDLRVNCLLAQGSQETCTINCGCQHMGGLYQWSAGRSRKFTNGAQNEVCGPFTHWKLRARKSPDNSKLSDRDGLCAACMAAAASVTAGTVRCSSWLGVSQNYNCCKSGITCRTTVARLFDQ